MQRKRDFSAPYSAENDGDIYKLSAQLTIISHDNIHSIGEFEGKISKLKKSYEDTRQELNRISAQQEHMGGLREQAELYFSLKDKPKLSPAEQLKLSISRQAMENFNLHTKDDFDRLKALFEETGKKVAVGIPKYFV